MGQGVKGVGAGIGYFMRGFDIVRTPGIRRFVYIPLAVNVLLFSVAFYWLFGQIDQMMGALLDWLPDWLDWLSFLLWPLAVIAVLVLFSFLFSTIANWIAAPFNGLLAERVEQLLSGEPVDSGGWLDLVKDLPRIFKREVEKLIYYLPKALGVLLLWLLLFFIPVIGQGAGTALWFLFTAWMMAIQYADYPFDNHKVRFAQMRQVLAADRSRSIGFGAMVTLFTMIPLLNLLVMPVAVCGATALWVENYRAQLKRG